MSGNNRLWIIATAMISIAVLALGWFLGISPQLAQANAADAQRASVEAENQVHEVELQSLKKQFTGIQKLRDELEELRIALPNSPELSTFVAEIVDLKNKYGVSVTSFSMAPAIHYASIDPVPGPTAAPAPVDPSATPSPSESAAPTPPVVTATSPNPLVTPDNFVAIQVTLKVQGVDPGLSQFLDDLQHGDRLFLFTHLKIGAVAVTAPTTGKTAAPTLIAEIEVTGLIYVLLDN
jgi:hypothetical protein